MIIYNGKGEQSIVNENKYLNRLKKQYYEVKRNFIPSENNYIQIRYNAMREFCIDCKLLTFNDIELMEYEMNNKVNKSF